MNAMEQERLEQNIRRTAGVRALEEIRGIVDDDLREEAARKKWLAILLRYGWIVLLLAAGMLARYMGVI
ncbi:MAG: hypothetical protein FD134_1411 [Gallionellaceae bacterium]|nr:MAG: hypothetical protein FD134_1411 [Gallionellaceae bacterium]